MSFPATMPTDSTKYLDNVIDNGIVEARAAGASTMTVRATPEHYIPFRFDSAGDTGDIPTSSIQAARDALRMRGYIIMPEAAEQAALL